MKTINCFICSTCTESVEHQFYLSRSMPGNLNSCLVVTGYVVMSFGCGWVKMSALPALVLSELRMNFLSSVFCETHQVTRQCVKLLSRMLLLAADRTAMEFELADDGTIMQLLSEYYVKQMKVKKLVEQNRSRACCSKLPRLTAFSFQDVFSRTPQTTSRQLEALLKSNLKLAGLAWVRQSGTWKEYF